jgi:hypothetical protein
MTKLTQLELDCLKKIANGSSTVTSPCADHILKNLLTFGLIEQGPRIWLPIEMIHTEYQLTPAGRRALQLHRTGE